MVFSVLVSQRQKVACSRTVLLPYANRCSPTLPNNCLEVATVFSRFCSFFWKRHARFIIRRIAPTAAFNSLSAIGRVSDPAVVRIQAPAPTSYVIMANEIKRGALQIINITAHSFIQRKCEGNWSAVVTSHIGYT